MENKQIFLPKDAWTKYSFQINPYRFQDGNSGAFFTYIPGVISDTIQQMIQDTICLQYTHLGSDWSSDDVLGYFAEDFGIIKRETETIDEFRTRILTKWEFVNNYGQQAKLQSELEACLDGSYTVEIKTTNLMGTDTQISGPKASSYSIAPYPPSSENNTQFNVIFRFPSGSIGTGTQSDLVSDYQIGLIRSNLKLIKPVNWACRELIFIYDSAGTTPVYDGANDYDSGLVDWETAATYSSYLMERHGYYNV